MPSKCSTCPFLPSGDSVVRKRVTRRIIEDSSQVCHHPALSGKPQTHICRGARDIQLTVMHALGAIKAPTDKAWADRLKDLGIANNPIGKKTRR